jgi:hypothetical protein
MKMMTNMQLARPIFFLGALLASYSIMASELSCPSDYTLEQKAQVLLELEFSGVRIDGMEGHECLEQDNFSFVRAEYDPSQELSEGADVILSADDEKTLVISDIKIIDQELGVIQAHFSIAGHKDEFLFLLHQSAEAQTEGGCAGILQGPEKRFVRKHCLPTP